MAKQGSSASVVKTAPARSEQGNVSRRDTASAAEFARSPSKPYDADRNVRHKVYRHKHYKLESGASLFRGIFFEPLHRLRLNVAILRCYRLRVGVLVDVVWVSCSERFASGLCEVQSAGGK